MGESCCGLKDGTVGLISRKELNGLKLDNILYYWDVCLRSGPSKEKKLVRWSLPLHGFFEILCGWGQREASQAQ